MLLAPLMERLRALGKDPEALFARGAFKGADLATPHSRLDNATILRAWERAVELSGDENIGLTMAAAYRPGTFHVIDYLVTSAPNLREGLAVGARYLRLLHDLAELRIEQGPTLTTLHQQPSSQMPVPRAETDFLLGSLAALCRRVSGEPNVLHSVSLPHPAPKDPRVARAFFRCPVRWGAASANLVLPTSALDRPCPTSDPVLHRILLDHAGLLLAQRPDGSPTLLKVRGQLTRLLQEAPSLARTARELGMSARSLRRQLEAQGTSYQRLLDEVRHEAASRLLRDQQRSLQEVASAVGFATTTALHRAFRRWTGVTPLAYRRAQAAPP